MKTLFHHIASQPFILTFIHVTCTKVIQQGLITSNQIIPPIQICQPNSPSVYVSLSHVQSPISFLLSPSNPYYFFDHLVKISRYLTSPVQIEFMISIIGKLMMLQMISLHPNHLISINLIFKLSTCICQNTKTSLPIWW